MALPARGGVSAPRPGDIVGDGPGETTGSGRLSHATGSLATSPPRRAVGRRRLPTADREPGDIAAGDGHRDDVSHGDREPGDISAGDGQWGVVVSHGDREPGDIAAGDGHGMVSLVTVAATNTMAASPSNLVASPTATGHVAASLGNATASSGSMAAATSSGVVCPGPTGNNANSVASPVVKAPVATMAAATGMVSMEMMQMAGVDVATGPMEIVTVVVASPTPSPTMETAAPRTPVKLLPAPFPSPSVVVAAPSLVVPERSSPTATEGPADLESTASQDMGSQSSLGPGIPPPRPPPAPDTLSYLDSVSLMSGTLESLSGPGFSDDVSSLGSDSEINGLAYRRTDKYGFLGGNQHSGMLDEHPSRWTRAHISIKHGSGGASHVPRYVFSLRINGFSRCDSRR
ncbi:uncharacterized protein LOC142046708 [Chelonoidis abingdonii]|uniref:uncharacterized protein LOC142046708 n=1 Tax=Chelonoidis abingdonii TaxID=106734 RepID=UPI003F49A73F